MLAKKEVIFCKGVGLTLFHLALSNSFLFFFFFFFFFLCMHSGLVYLLFDPKSLYETSSLGRVCENECYLVNWSLASCCLRVVDWDG